MSARFSKGDRVRCVNADGSGGELAAGETYTVSAAKDCGALGHQVRVNGAAHTLWWREDRFEKVEPEFVVGQQISGDDYQRLPVGSKAQDKYSPTLVKVKDDAWRYDEPGSTSYPSSDWSDARTLTHLGDGTHAEPEDKDDLYVEPEPLKEGDWVQVWARVDNPEPDYDGDIALRVVRRGKSTGDGEATAWAHPDALIRPDAGQVPPWLVLPPLEEPKGIGAVVEAEVRGSDRHSFVRVDTADGTPCRWRSTYDGCGYEWAALEEPTLTRIGVPEGGAS